MIVSKSFTWSAKSRTCPLRRIAEQPRRAALPARIEGRDREAAAAQVVDGLEILFDELGAAVQDDDGAAHRRAVGRPARIAELDAVVGRDRVDDGALRNRIARDFDQTAKRHLSDAIASRPLPGDSCSQIDCLSATSKPRAARQRMIDRTKWPAVCDRRPIGRRRGRWQRPISCLPDVSRDGQMRLRERISPLRALTTRKKLRPCLRART